MEICDLEEDGKEGKNGVLGMEEMVEFIRRKCDGGEGVLMGRRVKTVIVRV